MGGSVGGYVGGTVGGDVGGAVVGGIAHIMGRFTEVFAPAVTIAKPDAGEHPMCCITIL